MPALRCSGAAALGLQIRQAEDEINSGHSLIIQHFSAAAGGHSMAGVVLQVPVEHFAKERCIRSVRESRA